MQEYLTCLTWQSIVEGVEAYEMENNIFNHSKIYSQENANILEALLERKVVPFIEIVSIFFPNRVAELDIDSYLADLIQTEAIHPVINDMLSLNIPLCFFTREYFYFQFGVIWGKYYITNIGEPESKIYTDNIISLLIQNGDLPEAIRRLPRLANKEILSAYYDDLLDYKSSTDEEIIFCEANYCPSEPRTLTHFESIKLLAEHGLEESLLRNIPLYLRVKGEYVRNNRQLRQSSNFTLLREANCGNASYKKRYKDIERLHDETSDNLYQGQIIRIKTSDRIYQGQAIHIKTIGIEKIKNGDGNHTYGTSIARSLEVQTTDLETKFHLKRQIISCGQRMPDGTYRNQFELKNTCRLREDVEALILEHTSKIQISEQSETTNFLDISIDCPPILSKENKADVAQKSLLQPARKTAPSIFELCNKLR